MSPVRAPVTLDGSRSPGIEELGRPPKGQGVVMTVWAWSAGRSSRRFHRPAPARRGRNHHVDIWSKSPQRRGAWEGRDGALLGWRWGTCW